VTRAARTVLLAAALLSPATALAGPIRPNAKRIDLELQNAEIHSVLEYFADVGRVNIVTETGVSGRVTARLRSVEWDVALEQILIALHLHMTVEGNVVYVRAESPAK
jgi:type IV pilus assembly protein PilQ